MAITEVSREIIWLRSVLEDLGFPQPAATPIEILADNTGAIALTRNPVNHKRNKHIDIRYHFIRELVETGTVVVIYVSTDKNIADFFTKALDSKRFTVLRDIIMNLVGR